MKSQTRQARVYADWAELNGPRLMGLLAMDRVRGKEIFSFEYDGGWLSGGCAQLLDPELQLFVGKQYLRDAKPNFGIFLDSAPDRWGRLLMRRREACCARRERRTEERLGELDYLLGVYDGQRMGAIRFQEGEREVFLNSDERRMDALSRLRHEPESAGRRADAQHHGKRQPVGCGLGVGDRSGVSSGCSSG